MMSAAIDPGRVVAGRYRLTEVLGSGGMGTVWLAVDELLGRLVAVKEVSPPAHVTEAESQTLRERTLREARTAARLNHPNIVTVYDVVEDGSRPWIVMELVQAKSLRDIVQQDGPLSPRQAARIGLQVLAALRAAHRLGIVHRDVKPGNVLIDDDGRAVLADFGIARGLDGSTLTTSEVLVGSPSYIAPERAHGEPGGPSSDLWSLGATLYAAVEGRPPYRRDGTVATLTAVATRSLIRRITPGPCGRSSAACWLAIRGSGSGPRPPNRCWSRWPGSMRPPRPRRFPRRARRAATAARPPAAVEAESAAGAAAAPAGPGTMASAERTRAFHRPVPPPGVPAPSGGPAGQSAGREAAGAQVPAPRLPHPLAGAGRAPRRRWLVWLITAAAIVAVLVVAVIALGTPGHRIASARPRTRTPARTPAASRAAASHPAASYPASSPAAGGAAGPQSEPASGAGQRAIIPASYHRYHDPTGFSVAVPTGWTVSHSGHLVYVSGPSGSRYLLIDQSNHPKPDPLADWRQQEASRRSTYPDYHRIRLQAISYPPAEKAADWEFTYDSADGPVHILNRNVLANATHAYALYWSTPASEWASSYHIFQVLAATFRPAPAGWAGPAELARTELARTELARTQPARTRGPD